MFKIFNQNNIFKNKFKLNENCFLEIGDFKDNEQIEVLIKKDSIIETTKKLNIDSNIYLNFTKKKVLIKGFNFEENICISTFLEGKKSEINKAIEVFKEMNRDVEIKFAGNIKIEGIECKDIKDKTIEFEEKEFVHKFFDGDIKEVLILDFVDLIYLGEGFNTGIKREHSYLPIFGQAIEKKAIVKVKHGVSIEEIFTKLNGNKEILSKIIAGGFIKGKQKASINEKIEGFEKGILFLTEKEENIGEEMPCIRCSKCLRVCSKKLNPIKLVDLYKRNDKEEFLKFGGDKCIECGLCSIVCPSNIQLSHKIITGKEIFIEKEIEEVRSESFV